jgi:periplasmic protein TonB
MTKRRFLASMPNTPSRTSDASPIRAGHLSVRLDGLEETHFLFEARERRMGGALGASVLGHAVAFIVVLLVLQLMPERIQEARLPERLPSEIVWIVEPGPGGGGGGGGNQMEAPAKQAELPGMDEISVPTLEVAAPVLVEAQPEEAPPVEALNIPAMMMAAATVTSPGVLESEGASEQVSQGSGSGGGAGTGTGSGIGSGQGSGLGAGFGGGTGGGAYHPGNGVETPTLVSDVKPQYTADAMRHKIQGVVLLECIVNKDGTVGDVKVKRSLDRLWGLDDEAIKAARQWRFIPGTRLGEPVPVIVSIELSFSLR